MDLDVRLWDGESFCDNTHFHFMNDTCMTTFEDTFISTSKQHAQLFALWR